MKPTFAARLSARFDKQSLLAPSRPARTLQASAPGLQRLRSWCEAGAGHDDPVSALSGPAFTFEPTSAMLPLSIARVACDDPDTGRDTVLALALDLDGSDALAACGSLLSRWQFRLQVKARDVLPWSVRHRSDPWDCGYLPDTPGALTALEDFVPRRPTLMVATGLTVAALTLRLRILVARRQAFDLPVRLLVLHSSVEPDDLPVEPSVPCARIGLV